MKYAKTLLLLIAGSIVGLLVGTGISFLFTSTPPSLFYYIGALILSPAEMTFGFVTCLDYFPTAISALMIGGVVLTILAWVVGLLRGSPGAAWLALVGATLWSMGNVPILHMLMSV